MARSAPSIKSILHRSHSPYCRWRAQTSRADGRNTPPNRHRQRSNRFVADMRLRCGPRRGRLRVLLCAQRHGTISYSWSAPALGPVPRPWFAQWWFAMRGCCKPSTTYSQGRKPMQAPGKAVNCDEALSVSRGLSNNLGFPVDRGLATIGLPAAGCRYGIRK